MRGSAFVNHYCAVIGLLNPGRRLMLLNTETGVLDENPSFVGENGSCFDLLSSSDYSDIVSPTDSSENLVWTDRQRSDVIVRSGERSENWK